MKTKSVHLIKCDWEEFANIYSGKQTFISLTPEREIRSGDEVILQEWDQTTKCFTGRLFCCDVHSVFEGGKRGVLPGYIVLSIERISDAEINMNQTPLNPFRNLLNEHDN